MNNITIIGRLAQDPTVGKSKSNGEPVTLFNIASDSSIAGKTDFLHCMANYQTGKYVAQYGAKGMTIYAEGELTTGEHTNRDGVKIPSTTIMVRKVKFLSKNPNQQNNQPSGQAPRPQQNVPQTPPTPQNNGNYQQRPAQQQAPTYRNSAPIYQEACRGGQPPHGNGFAPGGNGYPAAPAYAQPPKTDFLDIPEGVDDCPFN